MSSSIAGTQLEAALYNIKNISNYRIFPLLLETVLVAFFVILVAYFACHRISKGPSGGKPWMLAFTAFSFILAITVWAIDIRILYQELYAFLPQQLSSLPDPDVVAALNQNHGALIYAQSTIENIIFLVSDSITFWRAYIICGRPRWLSVTILCFLFIQAGSFVFSRVILTIYLSNVPQAIVDLVAKYPKLIDIPAIVVFALVAAGQAFAALLIAYNTWLHWKDVKELLGRSRSMRSIAMLSITTETGIAYAALMVFSAAAQATTGATYYWTSFCVPALSAMYPSLVVVLIAVHGSYIERSIIQDLPTLQFSAPSATSHTDARTGCLPDYARADAKETDLAERLEDEKVAGIAAGITAQAADASGAATNSSARSSQVSIAV